MTIRILFSLAILSFGTLASAQQTMLEQHAQKARLTPEQLRAFRLNEIKEAFEEKTHETKWNAPEDKSSGFETEALGEVKVSKATPESEVHAAINPTDTNNIVISPIHNGGGFYMPIYYTTNFGGTWSKSSFSPAPTVSGAQVTGGGDPLFAYDANGKLYYTWIDVFSVGTSDSTYGAIYWASSTDKGKTWVRSAHDAVCSNWQLFTNGYETSGFDDKEWLAVDRNANSPYKNTLYMAWSKLSVDDGAVMLARKLPGVDSFEAPVRVSSIDLIKIQYTSIGIDAHGGIHVTYMGSENMSEYGIYHAYSADGGKTFEPEVKVADADVPNQSYDAVGDLIYGVRRNGNYPSPHLSIDTARTGNLYMVWNAYGTNENLTTGSQVYFSRSTDNGETWSDTIRVNNDIQLGGAVIDHFYPSIAVNGKGNIYVSWYDRREDPKNKIGRYYLAQSNDGGRSWGNSPIASKSMNFAHVMDKNGGLQYGFGVGEYNQLLVTPGYVIPVWADCRTNDGNLAIYTSFIQSTQALPTSGVNTERTASISGGITLDASYPNPAAGSVHCSYTLSNRERVRATVTDIQGNEVMSVLNQVSSEGKHDLTFDVSKLTNGTYYLSVETDGGYSSRAFTVSH